MKLIKKTDEYIVYLKRSGRYGVKNTDHEWINGISKTRILLAEGLVETTLPPEPDADAGDAGDDTEVAGAPDIAVAEEESSSATEAEDSAPEETADASDEEDSETSTASDSSDDVANADTTDEEEPEAIEDAEGKEP